MHAARALAALMICSFPSLGGATEEISVERGRLVSIVGGCHDCHTEGYSQSAGNINLDKALKGSSIGWRGPWGTTYPENIRAIVARLDEDLFYGYMKELRTRPPMPWYNVRMMSESDIRSFYRYVKSLGEVGEMPPEYVAADREPKTPFIILDPPQMPAACTRDFDCDIGLVCSASPVRACVAKQ